VQTVADCRGPCMRVESDRRLDSLACPAGARSASGGSTRHLLSRALLIRRLIRMHDRRHLTPPSVAAPSPDCIAMTGVACPLLPKSASINCRRVICALTLIARSMRASAALCMNQLWRLQMYTIEHIHTLEVIDCGVTQESHLPTIGC
jgi:hypothetical protein